MHDIRTISLGSAAVAALSAALLSATAHAQDAAGLPDRAEPTSDDLHDTIVVRAAGIDQLDVLAGTSVMDGTELQRNLDGQVGEVLARLPGVSASGFAPGASRPVLRGFGGERVRVLTDGVGALDASGASADHAVAIDPLIADRIEVLRGPAVLLYGSEAIGGAVNVITKRIPPRLPDEALHVDALAGIDTAYDLREGGVSLDAPVGGGFAFHVDGSWRQTDDMEIPGYAASKGLRADLLSAAAEEEAEGHDDEAAELREAAGIRGTLPNSWTETWSLGTGAAYFSGNSNIGVSFDYYDTAYGVPGLPGIGHVHGEDDGPEEDEGHGEEDVSIGLKRYRADLRGVLDTGEGFIDEIRTRWGWSNYTHTEFEGEETGTVFDVEGVEGRVELVQSPRGGWQGSIGAQYASVDFVAVGEEAFVPPSKTENMAVFALQEVDLHPFSVELGGRYENVGIDAPTIGQSRSFDTLSGAAGLSYALDAGLRAGINFSRAERAPSAQELFADGPHIATQQYEIGDATLGKEGAWGAEAYLRGDLGPAKMSLGVYRNWFTGFIYLASDGSVEDGLPVYAFAQQGADQWGVEGEVSAYLYQSDAVSLLADVRGDYTRATLADGNPVPRMPPLSLSGALEAQFDHLDARAEIEWFDSQTRTAPLETPTDAFTLVNLSLAWHPLEGSNNVTLLAQVDNVLDAEGRRAASFTKDFVPLAGRNFKLTARASF